MSRRLLESAREAVHAAIGQSRQGYLYSGRSPLASLESTLETSIFFLMCLIANDHTCGVATSYYAGCSTGCDHTDHMAQCAAGTVSGFNALADTESIEPE